MYTISKKFTFEASHQLKNLPDGHPCTKLHGHSYVVIIELQDDKVNKAGFVKDYRELSIIKDWIDEQFDHTHLNDVVDFNPSAENLARFIFEVWFPSFPQLHSVTVKETEKTAAKYQL